MNPLQLTLVVCLAASAHRALGIDAYAERSATEKQLLVGVPTSLSSATDAILFFDDRWLASSTAVAMVGDTFLLPGWYYDPDTYTGWGYPSVFTRPGGGFRALFEGWANKTLHGTRMMLVADSDDGVVFHPLNLSGVRPFGVPNAVWGPMAGFSAVYDDATSGCPADERLKVLWKNTTISVSADGLHWRPNFAHWTSKRIDPGWSVYMNPLNTSEIVVTARPQTLRSDGRHAGFHAGDGWQGLGKSLNAQALPLDLLYADTAQMYGLPSFTYSGMVVSFWWRYVCVNITQCKGYGGGHVSSALAYSYDSRHWTAFGQTSNSTATSHFPELFPNVPGRRDAGQVYPNTLLEVDGRLLVHASASTHQHGFVEPGWSSMLTYELRIDGFVYLTNPPGTSRASLTTKVMTWLGGDLWVNADARDSGSISVGVVDAKGDVVPGYSIASAPPFTGNSTAFPWVWIGGKRMAALSSSKRKVAITVQLLGGARLYSIRGHFTFD